MEKGGSWLERKALKVPSWGPSTSLFGACPYLGPSLYQDGLQRALRGRSPVPVPGSLLVWGDGGGGWGGAATAVALLCCLSSISQGREHKRREPARAARFPPTQTSAQDKVRRGCAPGQQHNKSPPPPPAHCSAAGVVLSRIKGRKSPVLSGWGRRMLS